MTSRFKSRPGLQRIVNATRYSMAGLVDGLRVTQVGSVLMLRVE